MKMNQATNYSHQQRSRGTPFFKLLSFFSVVFFSVQALGAPPVAIGPEQINRMRQLTTFSDDFSETNFYDLDNPIELLVTIHALSLPDEGNAELVFTIDESFSEALKISENPDAIYFATLQLAQEAKRLNLGNGQLKKGVQARLTGWPANGNNYTPSVLLVDEVELVRGGKKFAMHADNPKMADKKAKKDKDDTSQE